MLQLKEKNFQKFVDSHSMGFLFIFFPLGSRISSINYADTSKEEYIWKISLVEKVGKLPVEQKTRLEFSDGCGLWCLVSFFFNLFIIPKTCLLLSFNVFQNNVVGSFLLVLTPTPLHLNLLAKQVFIPICGIYKDSWI